MVLKLKFTSPAKFYGSSLPRPRFYTDVKFNSDRVDPPVPVLDPLLEWANEAHWTMAGLSFKRLRLQGRIEGNVSKLRAERTPKEGQLPPIKKPPRSRDSDSPPPPPVASKRRRFMALIEDEDEDEMRVERLVKKLAVEFDRVAAEEEAAIASSTRSRKPRRGMKT